MRFTLLPGHRHDTVGVEPLIRGLGFGALLADKAFDADWIIEEMNERGAVVCIAQLGQRTAPIEIDLDLYKRRHKIENTFARRKDWRRVAMRFDRCPKVFLSACALAAIVMFWL